MLTDFPIQRILDHLVHRIVDVLPITSAGVTLIDADLSPRFVAAADDAALRYEQLQTGLGEGPCLLAYRSGLAVSVADLARETRFPRFASPALESGLRAVFTFPLCHGDLRLGALDLYRDAPGPLTDPSMRAAQTLADVASAYLINAQTRSDLQDATDQSRKAAMHDPLTGLPNRSLMAELLDQAFRRNHRSGRQSAVFFVDLDNFKAVNDTYGHTVGDSLLAAVARRLANVLRPSDRIARLAGDEFLALREEIEDRAEAEVLAERLETALAPPFELGEVVVRVTASIGMSLSDRETHSAEDLLREADLAMYQRKRERRESGAVPDRRSPRHTSPPASVAHDLRGAIAREELHVEYQPIVEIADGRLTGVEALLRWNHPVRGSVAPSIFIPFAEQSGQVVEIGHWVLQQACNDRAAWRSEHGTEIPVSVNVSAHQLMSRGFAQSVSSVLEGGSIEPGQLWLEITETVLVLDNARARVVIGQLKELGVNISLDDFGTGYSSLSYLNKLPIDAIKLDQSFVASLVRDEETRKIVAAIIGLAHSLGLTVIAEGVETAAQRHELAALGSDLCQGYLFARAMPAERLSEALQHAAAPGGDGAASASIWPEARR